MDFITIGGTDRTTIIGDMAGILGAFMIGTHRIITVVITTVGRITIRTVTTIMAVLITTVATMVITAIMFTADADFHTVRPDEAVYHQITVQMLHEAVMLILRFTIHPEEAVAAIQIR